jgi:hypothetical protein
MRNNAVLSTNLARSQEICFGNVGKIVTSASAQFGQRNRVGPWTPIAQYTIFQNQLNSVSVHSGRQDISIKVCGSRNLNQISEGRFTVNFPVEIAGLQSGVRSIKVTEDI